MVDDLKYHGSGIGDSAVGWKDIGTTTVYRWTAAADKSTSYLKNTASLNALHQGICPNGWHLPSSLNEYPRPTMENGLISPEQKCVSYDEYKLCNLRQAYWTTNNYKDSANVLYFYRYANGYDDTYSVKKRYKNTFNVVRCVKD